MVKELKKRMLSLRSVGKIHTQAYQSKATTKKTKLDGEIQIFTGVHEEEEDLEDVQRYISKLYTLLVAYAMAGTVRVDGTDAMAGAILDVFGADQCAVVVVPLDVVMRYYSPQGMPWMPWMPWNSNGALDATGLRPGTISPVFRDGTKLCAEFQAGRCFKSNCANGKHFCGIILNSGRVCGGRHKPREQDCPKGKGKGAKK